MQPTKYESAVYVLCASRVGLAHEMSVKILSFCAWRGENTWRTISGRSLHVFPMIEGNERRVSLKRWKMVNKWFGFQSQSWHRNCIAGDSGQWECIAALGGRTAIASFLSFVSIEQRGSTAASSISWKRGQGLLSLSSWPQLAFSEKYVGSFVKICMLRFIYKKNSPFFTGQREG